MKMYCSECGTPHEYAGKKPNFCINCGFSLSGVDKSNAGEAKESKEIVEEIPEIDGLQIDIEPYGRNSIKIEDAIDYAVGNQGSAPEKIKRQKGKRLTKKAQQEFLKDWRREAGTSRSRNG